MARSSLSTAFVVMAALFFPGAAGATGGESGGKWISACTSVAMKAMEWSAKGGGEWPVVVDHELEGVTPEMITWWWDHIDNTERYQLWHPKDHIAFEWVAPPGAGHVGAVQRATEKIGGLPLAMLIRWDDPATVETTYDNVLAASIISEDGEVLMRFSHEYEATPTGTRMRSTFHVPRGLWFMRSGLRKHNIEEMANFPRFLPELYRKRDD